VGLWLKEISDKPPVIITNMGRGCLFGEGINITPPPGSDDNFFL
jgi:hypothetical protein